MDYKKVMTEIFEEIEKRVILDEIQDIHFQKFWEATPESFPRCFPYWNCFIILKDMTTLSFIVKPLQTS